MDDSSVAEQVWTPDPGIGGLYVLHLDGQAMADCSVTDRGRPREEQIRELAEADWIPPQQLTALYEQVDKGTQPRPMAARLAGDRRISPLRGDFGAVIDADDGPSGNAVRRYLFPELDRSGGLLLEPGEKIVTGWKSFEPKIVSYKGEDDSFLGLDPIPSSLLRKYRAVLTNRRLVYQGRLEPPKATREDYPSIFLPSVVFEGVATYRQVKRWVTRPNLHWAFHLRHEWLSEFGFGNRPDAKRPLLLRRDDTMFIHAGFRYPSGDKGVVRIPYKEVGPPLREIGEAYASAVGEFDPRLVVSPPVEREKQVASESLFSSKQERETVTIRSVDGGVPWSMPPTFADA